MPSRDRDGSAADAILKWHRTIDSPYLLEKLDRMIASPFSFFRGVYFLFAADLNPKPFLKAAGPVIGDIHTQNFGVFRAVNGEIVFDVNDFDETSNAPYEFDVCRLAVSLILAAHSNGLRLGDGMNAAEAATREWLASLARWRNLTRRQFERVEPTRAEQRLRASAAEKSRARFLESLAQQSSPGQFVFRPSDEFPLASADERAAASKAVPDFLENCLAPAGARPRRYTFQDVCRRIAGAGSLGRPRFAVLFGKGRDKEESYPSLRLVEWKLALDSSLESPRPHSTGKRARQVFEAARKFQLFPKRYLGYTKMSGLPMQAREIGANDRRFSPSDFKEMQRYEEIASLFGRILARCHLLGSMGETGPREVPVELHGREDRFVHHILNFAVEYTGQVHSDYADLISQRARVEKQWRLKIN